MASYPRVSASLFDEAITWNRKHKNEFILSHAVEELFIGIIL